MGNAVSNAAHVARRLSTPMREKGILDELLFGSLFCLLLVGKVGFRHTQSERPECAGTTDQKTNENRVRH